MLHARFDSAELIRGQEADHWKDIVAPDELRWRATVADDRQIVWFTGGRSTVGTSQPEAPEDGEGPLRHVQLAPFGIDAYAVTNERFARFLSDAGYRTDLEECGLPDNPSPDRAQPRAYSSQL